MSTTDLIPPVPLALIETLEQMFPDRLPEVDESIDLPTIHKLVGRQDIIRLLRAWHNEEHHTPQE